MKLAIGHPIFFGAGSGLYSIFSVSATNFGNLDANVGAFQFSSKESFQTSPRISRLERTVPPPRSRNDITHLAFGEKREIARKVPVSSYSISWFRSRKFVLEI